MPQNEYTPEHALEALLSRVKERDEQLAINIKHAIDSGTDIEETPVIQGKKSKAKTYRRSVPYTHKEALFVAIEALQAYFVELPLFIESVKSSFQKTECRDLPVSDTNNMPLFPNASSKIECLNEANCDKNIVIELKTERQITKQEQDIFDLKDVNCEDIDAMKEKIGNLKKLLTFKGGRNG